MVTPADHPGEVPTRVTSTSFNFMVPDGSTSTLPPSIMTSHNNRDVHLPDHQEALKRKVVASSKISAAPTQDRP